MHLPLVDRNPVVLAHFCLTVRVSAQPARKTATPAANSFAIRSERPGGEDVDEQQPHAEQLGGPPDVIERDQIRSKFFSISRRVSRSITGRPCGQTVEYAVARSSSRMCAIFS